MQREHAANPEAPQSEATLRFRPLIRKIKRIGRVAAGVDVFYRPQVRREFRMLGNYGAQFAVIPELLSPASTVYSFGIGTDISFDLLLIECFGVNVHAFDPTPRSLAWLQTFKHPAGLHVHPYGIADCDGVVPFEPPESPLHVSHRIATQRVSDRTVQAPVRRISTITRELGHSSIDLLKMDVEGAEYDAIDDLLASAIPVRQLCVEFHHRWKDIGVTRTRRAIESLCSNGFQIFHVSDTGEEYSFINGTTSL